MVLAATGRMGWRCRARPSSWPGVSVRSRKTEPCAWCRWAAGMGWEGRGRGWHGAGSVGGQGQSSADLGCWSRLCPCPCCAGFGVWRSCLRQDATKSCVDGAAKRSWGAHGAALEMGLVGPSTSGDAMRMHHCDHRQEHSPAQGTHMAMHLPCSAPGDRESKQCLNQRLMLKKIPQNLTAFY